MKTFIKEFKEFAIKGNVVDLAVAVIIGGAFRAIITSFVDGHHHAADCCSLFHSRLFRAFIHSETAHPS